MPDNEPISANQIRAIWTICLKELRWNRDEVHQRIGKKSVKDLTRGEAKELLDILSTMVGTQKQNWYRQCQERVFLPPSVRSMQPVTKAQMRIIIHLAGVVFDRNIERFAGFLLKRMRINRIVTINQAQTIIEALKSMSRRGRQHVKAGHRR